MNENLQWLRLDPLDTCFFKGAEPMIAGENHTARSIFPPMPSTLLGSIRTAILGQRKEDPVAYAQQGEIGRAILDRYPLLGPPEAPGFEVVGPLFMVPRPTGDLEWFYPLPANCMASKGALQHKGFIMVTRGDTASELVKSLGLSGSVEVPAWVLEPECADLMPLFGYWASAAAIDELSKGKAEILHCLSIDEYQGGAAICPLSTFYHAEDRIGIALDYGRRAARTGYFYAATHIRLAKGVAMGVAVTRDLIPSHLDAEGVLALGGEQRLVSYTSLNDPVEMPHGEGPWATSLSYFKWDLLSEMGWQDLPRVSGPPVRMAGWDLKKSFHKPVTAYLAPGSTVRTGISSTLPTGFIRY